MFLRWMKRLSGWCVALGVVGAIVYGFLPKPIAADLDRVVRGPLQVTVSEDGKTRVKHRYSIASPLGGQLLRVELEPGDRVEAMKTLVARLEPDLPLVLDARVVAQAEAKVRMAELTLQKAALTEQTAQKAMLNAEAHLGRTRRLKEKQASAQEILEDAELDDIRRKEEYAASKLAVDIARFELEWAKFALLEVQPQAEDQTTVGNVAPGEKKTASEKRTFNIYAPISGRVLRRFKESATPITPGTAIIEVGDPKRLELEIDVLSSDAVQIPAQAKVIIQAWGGEEPLHGIVRLVEPAAFTKVSALGVEEQRVYVIVDLVDPFEKRETLGDGYRVEAQIILWEGRDILKVPTSALFRKGADWAVFTVADGKAHLKKVEIGHRNGLEGEVLSGLQENDIVVIHPSDMIKEGAAITVRTQNLGNGN